MYSTNYHSVHVRLGRKRGTARGLPCSTEGCTALANGWSWDRTGPSCAGVHRGKQMSWGLDLDTYSPRCRSHAMMMDRGGTLTHCPKGHERAVTGTYAHSECRACADENRRARRASAK